jgi:hypothetical protein
MDFLSFLRSFPLFRHYLPVFRKDNHMQPGTLKTDPALPQLNGRSPSAHLLNEKDRLQ